MAIATCVVVACVCFCLAGLGHGGRWVADKMERWMRRRQRQRAMARARGQTLEGLLARGRQAKGESVRVF